jgi:phosphohistidine phosphatase
MKLLLMRHGKSETGAGLPDFDRPLAEAGVESAEVVGKFLERNGIIPDILISSPALRAASTAKIARKELGLPKEKMIFDTELYNANPETILRIIKNTDSIFSTIMLVGHNPGFEECASTLASSNRCLSMPTGSVACFETEEKSDWNSFPKKCRLKFFVEPSLLKKYNYK